MIHSHGGDGDRGGHIGQDWNTEQEVVLMLTLLVDNLPLAYRASAAALRGQGGRERATGSGAGIPRWWSCSSPPGGG